MHYGWFGIESDSLDPSQIGPGWTQLIIYLALLAASVFYVFRTQGSRSLEQDSMRLARMSAYIIRFAFWAVTLIGVIDMLISFLRVEELLEPIVGEWLTGQLGRPIFRR